MPSLLSRVIITSKHTFMNRRPMYRLQLQFHKQGEWENTVYQPLDYAKALKLLNEYREEWEGIHNYRIIPTGASK